PGGREGEGAAPLPRSVHLRLPRSNGSCTELENTTACAAANARGGREREGAAGTLERDRLRAGGSAPGGTREAGASGGSGPLGYASPRRRSSKLSVRANGSA